MNVIDTAIEDVKIIEPTVHEDARGYFYESFNLKEFSEKVAKDVYFVQDNESKSSYGVLRGMHFQKPPHTQAKLVRVVEGEVMDVVVDLRKGSPTYGGWVMALLSSENKRQLFVPSGFAHGFIVLSPTATFQYKCDNLYHPEAEGGIAYDSIPEFDFTNLVPRDKIILSEKDKNRVRLEDFDSPFVYDNLERL